MTETVGKQPVLPASTDTQARRYYATHAAKFTTPASRDVRHILVSSKSLADNLYAQLVAARGSNFAALAKKYSKDPGSASDGGKLGTLLKGQTLPQIDKVVFSLRTGEISRPVETPHGWHILQALSPIRPSHRTPYSAVRTQIISLLQAREKSTGGNQGSASSPPNQGGKTEAVAPRSDAPAMALIRQDLYTMDVALEAWTGSGCVRAGNCDAATRALDRAYSRFEQSVNTHLALIKGSTCHSAALGAALPELQQYALIEQAAPLVKARAFNEVTSILNMAAAKIRSETPSVKRAIAACSASSAQSSGYYYSPAFVQSFVSGCLQSVGTTETACKCVIKHAELKYSQTEFTPLALAGNNPSSPLYGKAQALINSCR